MRKIRLPLIPLIRIIASITFLCIFVPGLNSDSALMAVDLVRIIWDGFRLRYFDVYSLFDILSLLAALWLLVFSQATSKASAVGTMIALAIMCIPCALILRFLVAVNVIFRPWALPIAAFLLLALWLFWVSCRSLLRAWRR